MTIQDLREKLDEKMVQAEEEMALSRKTSLYSYNCGYDTGWRDALKTVLNTINGEEDNIL